MNEVIKSTTESDIKKLIEDRLTIARSQGKLLYFRLNAGMTVLEDKGVRRVIKGQPTGTSDFLVLIPTRYPTQGLFRVVFIEAKRPHGGKQSDAQKAFQKEVESIGAEYFIVKSYEDLEGVLR